VDDEQWTAPAPPVSDRILVERCLAGDQAAWTLLLEKYERLIYGVALRQGLNETQAGDVFQNVALLLLQHLEQVRDIDRLPGWLTTVTRREAWREQQHVTAGSMDTTPLIEYHVDTSASVEDVVEQWEAFEALRVALDASDERCRVLLQRLYLQVPPTRYEEIAWELGMPIGSIGPTRARCLQKLRDSFPLRAWQALS
jgi:RNA polymerase sigma factor (sigma-70 family)